MLLPGYYSTEAAKEGAGWETRFRRLHSHAGLANWDNSKPEKSNNCEGGISLPFQSSNQSKLPGFKCPFIDFFLPPPTQLKNNFAFVSSVSGWACSLNALPFPSSLPFHLALVLTVASQQQLMIDVKAGSKQLLI